MIGDKARKDDEIREWIKGLMSDNGLTASALAGEAGLHSSTLTRFMNAQTGHSLSMRSIRMLERHYNSRAPRAGSLVSAPDREAFKAAEAIAHNMSDEGLANALLARVTDEALSASGYIAGDFVMISNDKSPGTGDVIAFARGMKMTSVPSCTLRILDMPFIHPHSHGDAIQRPDLYNPQDDTILGLVIGSFRLRKPAH